MRTGNMASGREEFFILNNLNCEELRVASGYHAGQHTWLVLERVTAGALQKDAAWSVTQLNVCLWYYYLKFAFKLRD